MDISERGAPPEPAEAPAPEQKTSGGKGSGRPRKKEKKERTLKQRLTSAGIALVVVCFLLGLFAGMGGAYLLLRFFPDLIPQAETAAAEISDGLWHTLPAAGNANGTGDDADAPAVSNADIYDRAAQCVVGIEAVRKTKVKGLFGFPVSRTVTAVGSGFFVRSNGYIVTNHHVVQNAESLTVALYGGETLPASVIGADESLDLAVLKVDGSYASVQIGSSASLRVGDGVLVIGDPLGKLPGTLTSGVVSHLCRTVKNERGVTLNMFQTDAALNEGNSGGPVFDMRGQVVGVVGAKYDAGSAAGLGFCIPIDDLIGKIDDIIVRGSSGAKPVMGVSVHFVSGAAARQAGLSEGCFVAAVGEGSGAAKAGVKTGDVITAVDGTAVTTAAQLSAVLSRRTPGDTVTLTLTRGGQETSLRITLDEPAASAAPRTQYANVHDY